MSNTYSCDTAGWLAPGLASSPTTGTESVAKKHTRVGARRLRFSNLVQQSRRAGRVSLLYLGHEFQWSSFLLLLFLLVVRLIL